MPPYPHLNKEPSTELDWFEAVINLARFLRSPQGCPWDRDQNSANFAEFLTEEAQELVEALKTGDNSHIEEELGDTLFTILATAAAAEEEGRLSLENALRRIHEKMIRRHEHVFGDAKADTPDEVLEVWRRAKKKEKSDET